MGSEDDNVEEINIFEGKDNRITFEQVYTKTFKCTYQLQLYPFDTQVKDARIKEEENTHLGLHRQPDSQEAGDGGHGHHPAHPYDGVRDRSHPVPHNKLVG